MERQGYCASWKRALIAVGMTSQICCMCCSGAPPCTPPPPESKQTQCTDPPKDWPDNAQKIQLYQENAVYSAKLAFNALDPQTQTNVSSLFAVTLNCIDAADRQYISTVNLYVATGQREHPDQTACGICSRLGRFLQRSEQTLSSVGRSAESSHQFAESCPTHARS